MVYHNLSMSLNHHVPIFNCTVTRRGGVFSLFFLCSDTWVTVKKRCRVPRHWRFSTTHTHKQTDGCIWLPSCSPPSILLPFVCVTSPVLGHVTSLYIDCGHFFFKLHIQCPYVHTTDALHGNDTQLGSKRRRRSVSVQRDHFQAFSNMEETQHWSSYGCFCFFCCFFLLSLLLKARWYFLKLPMKLIFSSLLTNAKITHNVTWRREPCICSFH